MERLVWVLEMFTGPLLAAAGLATLPLWGLDGDSCFVAACAGSWCYWIGCKDSGWVEYCRAVRRELNRHEG